MPLPHAAIIVVHRSDGSGTTSILSAYLAKVSPEWSQEVGHGLSVKWPVGIGAQGSSHDAYPVTGLTFLLIAKDGTNARRAAGHSRLYPIRRERRSRSGRGLGLRKVAEIDSGTGPWFARRNATRWSTCEIDLKVRRTLERLLVQGARSLQSSNEFLHARQNAAHPHRLPTLGVAKELPSAGLPGIYQALQATRHLLEMYRRQLGNEKTHRRLLPLGKPLFTVASQLQRIQTEQK